MKAILKSIHSPDVDFDKFWPDEADDFGFLLQAMIGPEEDDSFQSFDMQICTPKWLISNYSSEGLVFGRHMIIVFDYDVDLIISKIEEYCGKCVGREWAELEEKIGRIGKSEFEDYISYQGQGS
ncbi:MULTISPECIES: immunity 8 family protein [Motilimonas]|uniref:Immunity 8 family protein n=1 Tax=Motilimonas cestriensis TaxID=2742685 RepID=A0ABS8WB40_9GAMM|nr:MULTISPECIES: immunity 8 family protein [Motilimonas]MCE0556155.1 immunity 8 family protein [Motilimonas sp. E26]MCE2595463.1 immunity 8 family protein [Motilimonas cestriensis]